MFGGWHQGKTQTAIEVFDLEKCSTNDWASGSKLLQPDMITKRAVVIDTIIAI